MKRLILFFLLFVPVLLAAQQSPADKLFDKYSGKEGYTSVLISRHLFGLFAKMDMQDKELENLMTRLSSIKILSAENVKDARINFHREIIGELPMKEYTELMVVKEKNQEFTFLIRERNGRISELLMISGGIDNNTLISIQGDIDLKTISNLSRSINIQGLQNLEKIEDKK